jgi:hypothetical protein
MLDLPFGRYALGICAAIAVLSGCGGSRMTSPLPDQMTNDLRQYPLANNGYKSLYNFKGSPDDGAFPYAGLVTVNGALYGTTVLVEKAVTGPSSESRREEPGGLTANATANAPSDFRLFLLPKMAFLLASATFHFFRFPRR